MSSPASSHLPHLRHKDDHDDDDDCYGPKLPPPDSSSDRVIGPILPPHLQRSHEAGDEEADDETTIGPLPPGSHDDPHPDIVAKKPKTHDHGPQREEWMTVIPEKVERKLGFKSVTSFSQRPVESTKGTKGTVVNLSVGKEQLQMQKEYEDRKRAASLLDIHQDELKKKKEETPITKAERQPFDPEKDLQVRKLDTRQTQSVISNSKLLNTRFSSGPSKFL